MSIEFLKKDLFTEEELKGDTGRLVYFFNKIAAERPTEIDQLTYVDFFKGSKSKSQSINGWTLCQIIEFLIC